MTQPELLVAARAQAKRLAASGGAGASYGRRWLELLEGDAAALERVLTEDSEQARTLRSSTPFAGALPPRERWALWRAVAEGLVP